MLRTTLLEASEAGSRILKHYFNGTFEVSHKSNINDLVTQADKESEAAIVEVIRASFPDHHILSEEVGALPGNASYKWIIDPIDGTVNFANGIPLCCVSIALEKDGQMIMGAVYNPFLHEFFFAERGKGATLNDRPIHVSAQKEVARSCVVTGFPYTYLDSPNGPLQVFERFIRRGVPMRRLGSAAIDLCWVAAGRFDAFYEHKLQAWDSAAGFLIVEEAGGRVTDFTGGPYSPYQPGIIATNGIIHEEMLRWVNG
ncbi:inositol monophosphatase family protein [Dinghuibacter silviterrae]|uniref:Inositol-1-monophosphatase n=1 Tax=Dinghuibacter silviterrae TaxID=1539049 RepID=A0A4R8DPF1_9BACT|nr:inositol monophosphatase family protein [Dinghuibacter silviterrae]TDW99577.1 myo-inositol-1(or 4)-monophosphatase [Dinghuibacter silviterrae]